MRAENTGTTTSTFECKVCLATVGMIYNMNTPMQNVLTRARNFMLISRLNTDCMHDIVREVTPAQYTPPVRLASPHTKEKQMKHLHGEGTHVNGGSSRLEVTREHVSDNYQRFTTVLPDGSTLKIWVPRLDFRTMAPETREIVLYQNREAPRPHPINLDEEFNSVVKKTTSTKRRTK